MPTQDTSQNTRAKVLSGRELSKFHRLNPYSPQGGRHTFSQSYFHLNTNSMRDQYDKT